MLLEGRIITDGMDIIAYLDGKLEDLKTSHETPTGIIIGTMARKLLSAACQKVMDQPVKDDITVNRFRGTLLIEDGSNLERVEIVHAKSPVLPVEGNPFSGGLKRVRP